MAKIKLQDVRLSFPDLFTPVGFEEGDKKLRYNATFLVVPGSENDKAIRAAIDAAAEEAWPKKSAAMLESFKGNSNKYCYLNGDTKDYDGYEGMMYLSSHRGSGDGAPAVKGADIDPSTGKVRDLKAEDGIPYAGCYVHAVVEIYAQSNKYPGIRCGLVGVQFVRDGDAFSGASRAKDGDFEPITEGISAGDLG